MADEDDHNLELVRAFRLAFGSPAGQTVLNHLSLFCHAAQTTHDPDKPMLMLEGRRQVWLVIQTFLNLTPEEIVSLAQAKQIRQGGTYE